APGRRLLVGHVVLSSCFRAHHALWSRAHLPTKNDHGASQAVHPPADATSLLAPSSVRQGPTPAPPRPALSAHALGAPSRRRPMRGSASESLRFFAESVARAVRPRAVTLWAR